MKSLSAQYVSNDIEELMGPGPNVVRFLGPTLADARRLIALGLDIIPLGIRVKGCFIKGWTQADPYTIEGFQRAAVSGGNLGIRTGRQIPGGILHVLDVDVEADRPEAAADAYAAARRLLPEIDACPSVVSGGAGGGRHYYILLSEPFAKFVPLLGDGWKIEFLGRGEQSLLPPSIHPKTGNTYRWERPLDLDCFDLVGDFGIPKIATERVLAWGGRPHIERDDTPAPVLAEVSDWQRAWAEDQVTDAVDSLARSGPDLDGRDSRELLIRAAHWFGGLAAHGLVEKAAAWERVAAALETNGLAEFNRSIGKPRELLSQFNRSWKKGLTRPARVPEDILANAAAELEDLPPLPDTPARPVKAPVVPARLNFLTPDQCSAERSRGYVVKGMFAPGDVGMIFGQPGAGKSLIAPYLGYMVAQGEIAFEMRTKAGKVFYVAAEDPHGLKGRVRALRRCHGPADNFTLVDGVSDMLASDSPDLAALEAAVEEQRPSLIFVDTLAMAFPGLEENDAAAMGHVVRVARGLAKWGAAVVLIHHPPKAGGTPRGHGLLNGALDVALSIERGEDGVIRGALTKNRNGTCDRDIAFTIAVEDDGVDEDGDRVTLPRAEPFDPRDLLDELTSVERKALRTLDVLIEEAQKIDPTASAIPEADWKIACVAPGALSESENPDSRGRAFSRGRQGLASKGRTSVDNGLVRKITLSSNGLPENGQSGQVPDKADCPPRHT